MQTSPQRPQPDLCAVGGCATALSRRRGAAEVALVQTAMLSGARIISPLSIHCRGRPVRRHECGPGGGRGAGGAARQWHWPGVARVGACAGARPIHRAVALVPRTFGRELLEGAWGSRIRPPPRKLRAVTRALGVSRWMAASWRHRRRYISTSTPETHRGCSYVM